MSAADKYAGEATDMSRIRHTHGEVDVFMSRIARLQPPGSDTATATPTGAAAETAVRTTAASLHATPQYQTEFLRRGFYQCLRNDTGQYVQRYGTAVLSALSGLQISSKQRRISIAE